jgi:hypothetical protein
MIKSWHSLLAQRRYSGALLIAYCWCAMLLKQQANNFMEYWGEDKIAQYFQDLRERVLLSAAKKKGMLDCISELCTAHQEAQGSSSSCNCIHSLHKNLHTFAAVCVLSIAFSVHVVLHSSVASCSTVSD